MKKGATTSLGHTPESLKIIALRNEKGSYNRFCYLVLVCRIIALRNEKGSYNINHLLSQTRRIIALRNEKGSYNAWEYDY